MTTRLKQFTADFLAGKRTRYAIAQDLKASDYTKASNRMLVSLRDHLDRNPKLKAQLINSLLKP
jgi:hypothetical protein